MRGKESSADGLDIDTASGRSAKRDNSRPPSRTKWTRRVLHLVLIGHAASLTPYYQAMPPATVARWAPRVALLNVYGTTEATVYQTARRVPPPPPPSY